MELLLNPLHDKAGATLGRWRKWTVPLVFHTVEQEYRAVREHAGLLDLSPWSLLAVDGADRAEFLHRLLTNDINALAPGEGCRAFLLTPSAKIVAECLVLADPAIHWLLVDGACADTALKTLDQYLFTEAATCSDHTARTVCFALQGPQSRAILNRLADRDITLASPLAHQLVTCDPAEARRIHTERSAGTERVPAEAKAIGAERSAGTERVPATLRILRYSLTGEDGFLLIASAEQAAWVWEQVLAQPGVQPIGWNAWNILRVEAGLPWWGIDFDETTLLPETGLERETVSSTKGCYVGQEIVARLETYGSVSRKLMGLVCEGHVVPQARDPILKEHDAVGEVTSACFSPRLKRPIALGYVKRPAYEADTQVDVGTPGRMVRARLTALPFSHGRSG